jgi:molecular chaperone GrpE
VTEDPHRRDDPAPGPEPDGSADPSAAGPGDVGSTTPDPADAAEAAPAQGEPPAGEASPSSGRQADEDGPASPQGAAPDMSAFEEDVEDSELAAAVAQVDKLGDDLAHARADLYNLNQEYGNYVRRSKEAASQARVAGQEEVVSALISVLDDIDAARSHGELTDGPFAAIARKLEETLGTRFALERYGEAGDDFDPQIHEALLAQASPEADHPVVGQVLQPGYRMGERILRAAKVMVHNPQ